MSAPTHKPAELLTALLRIVDSAPTALDLKELVAVQTVTRADDDDPIMMLYVAEQMNRHLDRKVRDEVQVTFESAKEASKLAIAESVAAGKKVIAESLASSVDMAAFNERLQRYAWWTIGTVVAAIVLIVASASAAGVYLIQRSADSATTSIALQQASFAAQEIAAANAAAAQAADKVTNAIAADLHEKFVTDLDSMVRARVLAGLDFAESKKTTVETLLTAEGKTPGVLKFAISDEAAALWRAEQRTPGLTEFATRYGAEALKLYRANGFVICRTHDIDDNGKATCNIWAPR
ncbi:hypothetical protein [Rhodoblastus sp.]|uniref:hypothetical protein n=1 Tax=Rhodoblastus sp. TaxID=1962975 RepID=UPI003F969FF7